MPDWDVYREKVSVRNDVEEGVAAKILRETQMVGSGVGGAFLDVAKNPFEKADELVAAGAFGVGLRALQSSGAKGRALTTVVGLGMAGKLAYDEYVGDRWSTFGAALQDNWQSSKNFDNNVLATKRSVGALAVDSTVSMVGFKAAGSHACSRALKVETGSNVPLRVRMETSGNLRALASSPRDPVLLEKIRAAANGTAEVNTASLTGAQLQGQTSTSFLKALAKSPRDPVMLGKIRDAAQGTLEVKNAGPAGLRSEIQSNLGVSPRDPVMLGKIRDAAQGTLEVKNAGPAGLRSEIQSNLAVSPRDPIMLEKIREAAKGTLEVKDASPAGLRSEIQPNLALSPRDPVMLGKIREAAKGTLEVKNANLPLSPRDPALLKAIRDAAKGNHG